MSATPRRAARSCATRSRSCSSTPTAASPSPTTATWSTRARLRTQLETAGIDLPDLQRHRGDRPPDGARAAALDRGAAALGAAPGARRVLARGLDRAAADRRARSPRLPPAGASAGSRTRTCCRRETCAFDLIEAEFIREIEPGEMVVIDDSGLRSVSIACAGRRPERARAEAFCVFEHVYFARPDSLRGRRSCIAAASAWARQLAVEQPIEADVVIPVPDSGVPAAIGYAARGRHPVRDGAHPRRTTSAARSSSRRTRSGTSACGSSSVAGARRGRRQARGRRRRLAGARHDVAQDRQDAAQRRRARGAPADLARRRPRTRASTASTRRPAASWSRRRTASTRSRATSHATRSATCPTKG